MQALVLHTLLASILVHTAAGGLAAGGRALQSVDELPEGLRPLTNGCEETQVAECQAAGKVCFNKACVQDACDDSPDALAPKCRAVCSQMAPGLTYACSKCDGVVVCTRDNALPILGALTKRRVRATRAMRAAQRSKARRGSAGAV